MRILRQRFHNYWFLQPPLLKHSFLVLPQKRGWKPASRISNYQCSRQQKRNTDTQDHSSFHWAHAFIQEKASDGNSYDSDFKHTLYHDLQFICINVTYMWPKSRCFSSREFSKNIFQAWHNRNNFNSTWASFLSLKF